ncbi:MAG: type II secretion system protein [Eubacteriales bacterium]
MIKAIKSKLNQKGFSLIELMVVIVIMLILAAIAIPAFMGVIQDAREASAQSEAKTVLMLAQLEQNKEDGLDMNDDSNDAAILEEAGLLDDADAYTIDVEDDGTVVVTYDDSGLDKSYDIVFTLPEQYTP